MDRDWTVAPGDTLRDWMDEQELPMRTAARTCGIELDTYRGLVEGVEPITPEIADRLARATGISVAFWLRMESAYREDLAAGRRRFE